MLSGSLSSCSDRLDPVRLREFVRLSNTQNRDAFASLGPFLRSLTGTEKVHLASSRTRRSDPCWRRAAAGKHDGDHRVRRTELLDSARSHADAYGLIGHRAVRFDLGFFTQQSRDEQGVERAPGIKFFAPDPDSMRSLSCGQRGPHNIPLFIELDSQRREPSEEV